MEILRDWIKHFRLGPTLDPVPGFDPEWFRGLSPSFLLQPELPLTTSKAENKLPA